MGRQMRRRRLYAVLGPPFPEPVGQYLSRGVPRWMRKIPPVPPEILAMEEEAERLSWSPAILAAMTKSKARVWRSVAFGIGDLDDVIAQCYDDVTAAVYSPAVV